MSDRGDAASDDERAGNPEGAIALSGETAEVATSKPAAADAEAAAAPSAAIEGAATAPKSLSDRIQDLKTLQQAMNAEKKRVTKDLRNHEKRRKRLKLNARRLSNDDLAEVILLREAAREAGSATTTGAASSSSSSTKKGKEKKPGREELKAPLKSPGKNERNTTRYTKRETKKTRHGVFECA